jgi:hypothetical protein
MKLFLINIGFQNKSVYFFLLACAILFSNTVVAQTNKILVQVIDSLTHRPLPYATVLRKDSDFISSTNIDGNCSFEVEKSSNPIEFTISHVGYHTKRLVLPEEKEIIVLLRPFVQILDTIEVNLRVPSKLEQRKARDILSAAHKNLQNNSKGYVAEGNFNHRMLENGQFVKLVDGRVLYSDKSSFSKVLNNPSTPLEEVEYLQKRTSFDFSVREPVFFTTNYSFYLDEFNFLLHNGLKYSRKSGMSSAVYSIVDSLVNDEFEMYKISIDLSYSRVDSLFGDMFVMAEMIYEIVKYKRLGGYLISSFTKNYISRRIKGDVNHSENNFFQIDLDNSKGDVLPLKISHLLYQNIIVGHDTTNIEAFHTIRFDKWEFLDSKVKKRGSQIIEAKYNPKYWEGVKVSQKEKIDLGKDLDIVEQFHISSQSDEFKHSQEKIYLNNLNHILNNSGAKKIYLIIWSDFSDIIEYFTKAPFLIPLNSITPVFVYIGKGMDERRWRFSCWGTDLMYFPNYYLPNLGNSLLEKGDYLPVFKIIENGKISLSQPTLIRFE